MIRKNDIILISIALILSIVSIFILNIRKNIKYKNSTDFVIMSVDGKVERKIELSKNGEYGIENDNGDYNIISIKDGVVKMKEANCPDKLCIHQGKISKNGETIVCLPHGLVVEIKSKKNPDVDIVR